MHHMQLMYMKKHTDKKWSKFHNKLQKEYPRKTSKEIDRIEAGIKRSRGWKPKKPRKRK